MILMYEWNPVYNMVMDIKRKYLETFCSIDIYDLKYWVDMLDMEEYNNIFKYLVMSQYKGMVLLRYSLISMDKCKNRDMWSNINSLFRECRSVVIDLVRDELVLAPFRKFFNLNEVPETSIDNIREKIATAHSVEITNKLDGSMQSARFYRGHIVLSGSKEMSPEKSCLAP
jgi:tRNA splicing ligase